MTVYSTDSFNRADSTTNLTTTDGAGSKDPLTWTQSAGTWGTLSNQAYTSAATGNSIAQVDSTFADVTVFVTLATSASATAGVCFRFSDTSNYWRFTLTSAGAWALISRVAASETTQANGSFTGTVNGSVLKVIANGSSIRAFINDTQVASVTSSSLSTNTKHGMFVNNSTAVRFDTFEIDNPHVVLNVTQTQTPTVNKAFTLARNTLTVTQTQTPTIPSRAAGHARTLTVTQTQTPTITVLEGIATSATGSESAPTYSLKVVGMTGTVATTLSNAEPDRVVWTLNHPDEFEFHFPKNAYTASQVTTLATASNVKEVQVYRNGDLLTWGPVIGIESNGKDGAVQCHGAGVDWYLNRRFLDGPITNLLTNGDFESGTSSWTATASVTATSSTSNFVTGSKSIKLVSSTAFADAEIYQQTSAGPNGVGLVVVASCWIFRETFTAPAYGELGLLLEGYKAGVLQANNFQPIDLVSPENSINNWAKMSTWIWIPPNETWDIKVRLFAPQGTSYYDDVKVVSYYSLATPAIGGVVNTPVDVVHLIREMVGHVQKTSYGKSDLNIGFDGDVTGTKVARNYQFVDHVQFDQALREWVERDDGLDYYVRLTPKTRTFRTFARKRGTDRSGSVTLRYVAGGGSNNCTDYRITTDAGACITRQVVLGEDNGPDREQGESSDTSQVAGIILQDVRQAPQDSKIASLQPLADERVQRFRKPPTNLEMDLIGSSGLIPTLKCGDLVAVVVTDGWADINTTMRIMKLTLDCKKNILTVALAEDDLT